MTDEQLNTIMHKADDDLDRLKDRCHDLYEENERLKKANKILEENWLAYMKINQEAIEYINNTIEDKPLTDFECGSNNACNDLLNILQNGSEEDGQTSKE